MVLPELLRTIESDGAKLLDKNVIEEICSRPGVGVRLAMLGHSENGWSRAYVLVYDEVDRKPIGMIEPLHNPSDYKGHRLILYGRDEC